MRQGPRYAQASVASLRLTGVYKKIKNKTLQHQGFAGRHRYSPEFLEIEVARKAHTL